ncbi:MAG: hypothetical protein OEW83_10575 [Acidimicrobiia bacterium]|nr:hypothetical protein [Acidimicrobiia bacterium]
MSEFLGEDILIWLMLAVGGALTLGTATALINPKSEVDEDELERPPLGRSLIQIAIGLVVVIWAAVSLFN